MEHSKNFKKVKEFYKTVSGLKDGVERSRQVDYPGRVQGNHRGGLQQGGLRL